MNQNKPADKQAKARQHARAAALGSKMKGINRSGAWP
jgi:hypothetical protein